MGTSFRLPLVMLAALIAGASACATSSAKQAPSSKSADVGKEVVREEYFVGTVETTSPDGATPFGLPVRTVAHRMRTAKGISEEVFYDGALRATSLLLNASTSSFATEDAAKTFSGTITFTGDPFLWATWTYTIAMRDGSGTISGTGVRNGSGFTATKTFTSGGASRAQISETFRLVDKAVYLEELKHLKADAAR